MHHSFSDVLFPMTTIDYLEQTYKEMSENNGVSTISLRSGEPNVSFTKLRVVTKRFLVLRTVVMSGVFDLLYFNTKDQKACYKNRKLSDEKNQNLRNCHKLKPTV